MLREATSRLTGATARLDNDDENDFSALLGSAGGASGADLVQLATLQLLMKMAKNEGGSDGVAGSAGRAVRRVHQMRNKPLTKPDATVLEYIEDTREEVGAEDGEPWQLWSLTEKLQWGKMQGLRRIHFHLSHILTMSLRGNRRQSEAYIAVLLRAVRQVQLDGGNWDNAMLLLPRRDPCAPRRFAATEADLETIVAYRDSMKRLNQMGSGGGGGGGGDKTTGDKDKDKGKGADKEKTKGAGKGKDKTGEDGTGLF